MSFLTKYLGDFICASAVTASCGRWLERRASVYPLKLLSANVGGNNFADKLWLADYEIALERQSSLPSFPHTQMVASLRKFRFPTSAGWNVCISSAARSVAGDVTCLKSAYFPPRPDPLLIGSYLREKSAQGAKSGLHVYIQLWGFGGFCFRLSSWIWRKFCTKHKVNGMTSPGQNPRFRVYKPSFVIYRWHQSDGCPWTPLCDCLHEFYGAAEVMKVCSLQYFSQKSDNFLHMEVWKAEAGLAAAGVGIIRCTGVEFKVCGHHCESNLCELFSFSECKNEATQSIRV